MLVNNLGWHNDQSKISQNFTHFIQMELSKNPKSENDISLSTVPSYSIHISNSFFLLLFLWSEVSNKKKKFSLCFCPMYAESNHIQCCQLVCSFASFCTTRCTTSNFGSSKNNCTSLTQQISIILGMFECPWIIQSSVILSYFMLPTTTSIKT